MNIAALLTGRGNNTFKDKNIVPVLGKPLMSWAAEEARKCPLIDHFFCSSDDDRILDCGESCGYERIKRPLELSSAQTQHIDVIKHALQIMRTHGYCPDILTVILCNSATVKVKWIEQSIRDILNDDSITSSCPVYTDQDHHPFRAKAVSNEGFLTPFFDFGDEDVSTNRQDLPRCVFLCHNFWTLNVKRSVYDENGQKPWKFLGQKIKPIYVEGCFDVHEGADVKRTEEWLRGKDKPNVS